MGLYLGVWFDSIFKLVQICGIHKCSLYSHVRFGHFWKVPVSSWMKRNTNIYCSDKDREVNYQSKWSITTYCLVVYVPQTAERLLETLETKIMVHTEILAFFQGLISREKSGFQGQPENLFHHMFNIQTCFAWFCVLRLKYFALHTSY